MSREKRNSAPGAALTFMTNFPGVLKKPPVIATIVAVICVTTMLMVDHTNLIVDHRPPQTPPGTTFNAANDAGATVAPTEPESPIKPRAPGPAPAQPANPVR